MGTEDNTDYGCAMYILYARNSVQFFFQTFLTYKDASYKYMIYYGRYIQSYTGLLY